jgi:hypothetical protein
VTGAKPTKVGTFTGTPPANGGNIGLLAVAIDEGRADWDFQ